LLFLPKIFYILDLHFLKPYKWNNVIE